MQEKYTYGMWGAVAGAIALGVVGFTWGDWHTSRGATQRAETAVLVALIPPCAREILADSAAVTALATKKPIDYDQVVSDYRKRIALSDRGYQFNRDCGRAIEAQLTKAAATK